MTGRLLAAGALGLALLALASVFVGVSSVSPLDVLTGAADERATLVLWESRIPRTLALLLAGASMAVAGTIMQMLARNRFVEPSTAGTVESASLGMLAVLLVAPGLPVFGKMLVAALFALAGTALFLGLLRRVPLRSALMVPLIGLMLGGVIRAATFFLAHRFDMLQSMGAWTSGDFSTVLAGRYEVLWVAFALAVAAYVAADRFTLAGLGEGFATGLGLNYRRVLDLGLGIVALVTASVVVTPHAPLHGARRGDPGAGLRHPRPRRHRALRDSRRHRARRGRQRRLPRPPASQARTCLLTGAGSRRGACWRGWRCWRPSPPPPS